MSTFKTVVDSLTSMMLLQSDATLSLLMENVPVVFLHIMSRTESCCVLC